MTNFTAYNGDKNGGPGHSLWALLQICLAQLANCDTLWWSWSWLCYRYSLSRPSKHHKWSQRELWKYSEWIADISNSKANLVKTSPWQASNPHHRNWISILESYIHCNILTYSISREFNGWFLKKSQRWLLKWPDNIALLQIFPRKHFKWNAQLSSRFGLY